MDRMIYNAMAGAKAAMQRQDVLSHNLANVSTTGFRAEMASFRAVPVRGDGASTRVYALETTLGHDDKAGPWNRTDRKLDVAMVGKSWLAVQGAGRHRGLHARRSSRHQRRGPAGHPNGLPVLGDGGPVTVPPNTTVQIGGDGTISAQGATGGPTTGRPPQAGDARGQVAAR
jgi:flagellar basal-body rod protein FlgF